MKAPCPARPGSTAVRARLFGGALLCTLALALAAGGADAHHSSAVYDRAKPITLKGVVRDLEWSNPHGWFEILTTADGGKPSTAWTVEMEGVNVMQREGWSRHSLMPGDRITARVMPLKDGRPGARLIDVIKADGTVLHLFTPRPAGA